MIALLEKNGLIGSIGTTDYGVVTFDPRNKTAVVMQNEFPLDLFKEVKTISIDNGWRQIWQGSQLNEPKFS